MVFRKSLLCLYAGCWCLVGATGKAEGGLRKRASTREERCGMMHLSLSAVMLPLFRRDVRLCRCPNPSYGSCSYCYYTPHLRRSVRPSVAEGLQEDPHVVLPDISAAGLDTTSSAVDLPGASSLEIMHVVGALRASRQRELEVLRSKSLPKQSRANHQKGVFEKMSC